MYGHPSRWKNTVSRPRDDVYSFIEPSVKPKQLADAVQHTQSPIVTGTSVLGLKFKGGVMVAADNLASYGSLARFKDVERILQAGDETVVAAGGDISDFQYISELLSNLLITESYAADGHKLSTKNIYEYLCRVMYNRRTKINPLWNSLLVAGLEKGEPFLAYVDLLGTSFKAPTLATGFGAHIAIPILRKYIDGRENEVSEQEAREILNNCMKALYYRDARSLNKFTVATVTSEGVKIEKNQVVETEWKFADMIKGYGVQNV